MHDRSSVSNYQNILELYKTDPTHKETLMYLLKGLIENPNVLVEGQLLEFEDLLAPDVIAETAAYIKEYLQSLNIPNAKATTLSKWYVIKRITKNGVAFYRIISRLVDNL